MVAHHVIGRITGALLAHFVYALHLRPDHLIREALP